MNKNISSQDKKEIIRAIKVIIDIVDRNFKEMQDIFKKFENEVNIHPLSKDIIDNYYMEYSRLLHNYVASVYTLIAQTHKFRNTINNNIFEKTVKEKLLEFNQITFVFFKELRTYCQHVNVPPLSLSVKFYGYGSTNLEKFTCDEKTFSFDIEALLKWDGWSRKVIDFIEKYNENNYDYDEDEEEENYIDMEKISKEFHDLLMNFNKWFVKKAGEYIN